MASAPVKPLIAIVGATGTGKSDLAVELARKFNGEIINGDAMQLYRGLPIITNKITQEEMKGVRHHLLGCIGLEEETVTVGNFVDQALGKIDEIRSRGKLPILVGGTHYYTQSFLVQDTLIGLPEVHLDQTRGQHPVLEEPTDVILAKLKEVDPVMADRWHPNERRKIQRSLEIYLRTGKPASQIYKEQRPGYNLSSLGERTPASDSYMRFPTLVFWVHADKAVLHPRLNARVDKMLDRGLLFEVQELNKFQHSYESRTGTRIDQTRGIWVSIGYKEFLDYQDLLSRDSTPTSELEASRTAAIEKTQAATRQYANRQVKWIRIKLLNLLRNEGQEINTFLIDGTDLSSWDTNVVQQATTITEKFLTGQTLPVPSSLSNAAAEMLKPKRDYDLGQRPDLWQKRVCETCGTVAVTENDWELHVKSRAHRKAVGGKTLNASKKDRRAAQEDVVDVLEEYLASLQGREDLDDIK